MITKEKVLSLFMERQQLGNKADPATYEELFRMMSPVATLYWTRPGDPPVQVNRARFDDRLHNDELRANRTIVKGRFQKGGIGYVFADELELYGSIYKTDLGKLTKQEHEILDLLEHEGSMNLHELKEVTGLLIKDLTPILHRLQEAFKVFEDQRDREWDRNWYAFENEFPEVDFHRYPKMASLQNVLCRFATMHVFFTVVMAKSFFQLPTVELGFAISELVAKGKLTPWEMDGEPGLIYTEDYEELEKSALSPVEPSIFLLHRNDFLVKSHEIDLKKKFKDVTGGVLHYLLVDGEFKGALFGRFTFGPVELTKLVIDLPGPSIRERMGEIVDALYKDIDPVGSPMPVIVEYQTGLTLE